MLKSNNSSKTYKKELRKISEEQAKLILKASEEAKKSKKVFKSLKDLFKDLNS